MNNIFNFGFAFCVLFFTTVICHSQVIPDENLLIHLDFNDRNPDFVQDKTGKYKGVFGYQVDPLQLPVFVDDAPSERNGDQSIQFFGGPGLSAEFDHNSIFDSETFSYLIDSTKARTIEFWFKLSGVHELQNVFSIGSRYYQQEL
jgi:hypothetical protein